MVRELLADDEEFITEVCWRYYVNGQTQADVARAMDATRLRVNQAIQKAKTLGIVNIRIESPFVMKMQLQQRLEEEFGLSKALVAPVDRENHDYHTSVGAALAHFLSSSVKNKGWKKIGVSSGVTLQRAVERLPKQTMQDVEILSLLGGLAVGSSFDAFSIASGFAEQFGAKYSHLVAPVYLPQNVDRDAFLEQGIYKDHLDKCRSADAALLVVGDVSDQSHLIKFGLPPEIDAQSLRDAGAVGDYLGRYLDKDGVEIDHFINDRTAGLDLPALAGIPNKILTAAGRHKVAIIRASIKRGLVDTLVTDDLTAEILLDEAS
jgi:DNA-binding transcriptional regulator LsrR (DeoR family)